MININKYILEKLHLNKNIKTDNVDDINSYEHLVNEIVELCDIKKSDTSTIDLITVWVNKYRFKKIYRITDLSILKRDGKENLLTHNEKFDDKPQEVREIITKLIINKEGNEFNLGKWNDPKIYYNDDILIFHDYKKYNIDKIFIKEK